MSPYSSSLRKMYRQMDSWDLELEKDFKLESSFKKMFFRRVSPAFVMLLQSYCTTLLDLFRLPVESDPSVSDEALVLRISVSKGKLPG